MEVQMDKKVDEHKKPSVWTPFLNQVLDEEEQQIENDIAAGLYVEAPDQAARLKEWQKAAASMRKRSPVTIRLMARTISALKSRAFEEGVPYQTLVSSVLHKYVTGRLKERD
jgi:predicted DNA binding CopG/RHH family protein